MNRRTVVIAIVLFIVSFTVFSVFITGNRPGREPAPAPSPTPPGSSFGSVRTPDEITVPNAPKNVIFTYVAAPPDVPSSLPVYPVTEQVGAEVGQQIAGGLGFAGKTKTITGTYEAVDIWTADNKSMTLVHSQGLTNLTYQDMLSERPIVGAPTKDVAGRLLERAVPPRGNLVYSFIGQQSAGFSGITILDSPPPELTAFQYGFTVDGKYPVLLTGYEPISISVVIDSKHVIRSLTYVFPPTVTAPGKPAVLLTFAEAVNALNDNRGRLVYTTTQQGEGAEPMFTAVRLNGFSVAYWYDRGASKLRPVFLFDGSALARGGSAVNVRYVVLADKQETPTTAP